MKKFKKMRTAIAVAGLMLLSGPAMAGDFADIRPIGFSADGSVFAFEEFGIQDGSGSPYSSIYFIDTNKDAYLPGTPIRVSFGEEPVGLAKARDEARAKALPLIEKYQLLDHPGLLAAFNPVTELGGAPDLVRYRSFAMEPPIGGPFTLKLETFPLPPTQQCKDMETGNAGFRLALMERDGKAVNEKVYEDTAIPESRNCPTSYRLGGVVTYEPSKGPQVHMALVLVMGRGFEGNDGRWIAVPLRP